jgi:hypothetical protein
MVQQLNQPKLELGGSPEQQELARQVWNLMRAQGAFFAADRPISQNLQNLADYFAGQKYKGITDAAELLPVIDEALSASPVVFNREEADDGTVFFKTTKKGKAPQQPGPIDHHSFRFRLKEDVTVVETPPEEVTETTEAATAVPEVAQAVPTVTPTAAAPQTPAPVVRPQVTPPSKPSVQPVATPAATAPTARPATPQPAVTQPEPQAPVQPAATMPKTEPAPATSAPAPAAQPAPVVAPVAQPAPVAAQPVPAPASAPATAAPSFATLPDGTTLDLSRPTDEIIAEYGEAISQVLQQSLTEDFRFVNFANDWYIEDITGRYGKSDFRRIREFMGEEQGPVSDTVILSDLYNKRQTDADYEATRFALNFRLFKEKKDFEFVGANDDRVWTAPGLPPIGQPRRKSSEIGTDYKYLEDSNQVDSGEIKMVNGRKRWEHVLTFYEYENGVLPFDASAKELIPGPLFEDQKSLVLRFEATQTYVNYTGEVRYPTPTRGGWIMGLEGFFSDNVVPGSIIIIEQARKSNHFLISYQEGDEQEQRLLFYDDRRQKFVFRPIVFACDVDNSQTLTPDRFGKLDGQRRLEESDRRKTDLIVANAFTYVGEKQGDSYYALLDDLFPVVNIERPFSRAYLRHLLSAGNSQFRPDEGMEDAFYYKPSGRR